MNRRRFLKLLGIAPVVAKVAPFMPELPPQVVLPGVINPLIGAYVSYRFKFTVCYPPPRLDLRRYKDAINRS